MSHTFRFLGQPETSQTWTVSGDENHHLTKVLRLEQGDIAEVTNGKGLWTVGRILTIGKSETVIESLQDPRGFPQVTQEQKIFPELVLCIGALKPGSLDEIIPSLVELGIDALHVFHQPGSAKSRLSEKAASRWERLINQAVKQSKRAYIPPLTFHNDLENLLHSSFAKKRSSPFFLSPDGPIHIWDQILGYKISGETNTSGSVWLVIGGEQGLSPLEETVLRKEGFQGVRLGPNILRAVTAAISATAILSSYRDRDQK